MKIRVHIAQWYESLFTEKPKDQRDDERDEDQLNGLVYRLVERAQAARADVGLRLLSVDDHGLLMRIGVPLAVGAPLGVAHVMSELYRFPTYITFAWHRIPFDQIVVLR